MVKDKVYFYPTDRQCHDALALYILNNIIVDARAVTFTQDDYIHEFHYNGMEEREWYGVMCGYRVISDKGEKIIFASWEDEPENIPEETSVLHSETEKEYVDKAYATFMRCLTMYN
ncbi:MAG: hypothetical protein HDS35_07600 [Bacteroides sp.]|nr:hypothetical protein [Bacteroides sp.]